MASVEPIWQHLSERLASVLSRSASLNLLLCLSLNLPRSAPCLPGAQALVANTWLCYKQMQALLGPLPMKLPTCLSETYKLNGHSSSSTCSLFADWHQMLIQLASAEQSRLRCESVHDAAIDSCCLVELV